MRRKIEDAWNWTKSRIKRDYCWELLLPFCDYWAVANDREKRTDILFPFFLAVIFGVLSGLWATPTAVQSLYAIACSSLAILAGFSMTAFTIFVTTQNHQIELMKESFAEDTLLGREKVSLYKLMYINLIVGLKLSVIALVPLLLIPVFFPPCASFFPVFLASFLAAFLFLVPLVLSVRNANSFYHTFFRSDRLAAAELGKDNASK